ncbi:DNA ligase D [Fulvivirgaceae bacterium PWU4]|uniref:DNA ligase (ATP) n=1 Tax=Chryseosolibacter histidini TaxID=2782349 RepID=A0AAP2GLB0_9BACT|nr:DNA ligase D [Chryseosolibacter histidini]MBT1700206.1 DNA ligase D [Chryseosolibacter histidini]
MGLTEYKRKRSFKKTPEPAGGKSSKKQQLHFVVQKHAASRLHYDFRLEMEGVLKSWAVPKGPSLNPADKRLAMMVEDHPYDYKDFEGTIPPGNYGAGTVIIWDEGTYEPLEATGTRAEQEKILLKQLEAGSLKFRMNGEKLKGEFALVRMKGKDANAWLLIKHRDAFAGDEDVTLQDKSVVSGKTIEELAEDDEAKTWKSNRTSTRAAKKTTPQKTAKKATAKKSARKTITPSTARSSPKKDPGTAVKDVLASISKKKKSAMPKDVMPMLATLVDKPFDQEGWLYEVKWDGFRAISYLQKGDAEIRSRNNKDMSAKFYPVLDALKQWPVNAVVDGEIIVVNEKGIPDFNALQEWRSEADGQLIYYMFDILWLDGYDLMKVPLAERKETLKQILPQHDMLRLSESFAINGTEFFQMANRMDLEGMLAKKADSVYTPDARSKNWLKIKTEKHQEAVIGGYTRNENTSKLFSALLMGVYEQGKLVSIGPVGTGFTTAMQKELLEKMKPLETSVCPFAVTPDYNKPSRFRPNPPKAEVTWLKPKLVAEVAYRSTGADGSMRHPSFRGLREDKNVKDVKREQPVPAEEIVQENGGAPQIITAVGKRERKTLLNPTDETQVRNINGHELKFTNLSKVFWPEIGITKRDMLNYYYQVAPYMLPYMKDRPQTLNRFPNGIHGESFYQKDVTGKVPGWIETYKYFSEGDQRQKHFMVCTDEASLLYIASLGCIEMNPWSSRVQSPDHPDWCIIDLDPDKRNTFDQVIEAAQVTKQVLDALEIPSWCKTSGSTGLHIFIPLGAKYTYEDSKEFARALVKIVHSQIPSFTSIERKVSDRKGNMYLDFLQNRPQATLAGPYSLRPKPGAPVSMPLHWDEVKKGLNILDFTIKNAMSRLKETGDLFEGVLGEGVNMKTALKAMHQAFKDAGV